MLRKPSQSYEIDLPEGIHEDNDESVSSYWVPGEELLLQVSSYSRESGEQIGAAARPSYRMSRHEGTWRPLGKSLLEHEAVDQAAWELRDEQSAVWIHAYFVWPRLAVYATVSGPELTIQEPNWAIAALRSIRLT